MRTLVCLVVTLAFLAPGASAEKLIPGPGEAGSDDVLHALAAQYDRQFHTFSAAHFGLSLDTHIPNASYRQLVYDFMAQDAEQDFLAWTTGQGTALDVEDIVGARGEHGDIGMFAGLPAAADAFRYALLRDNGAPAAEVDQARQDLLDAIAAFHVFATISGFPGGLARGVRFGDEYGTAVEAIPGNCPDAWTREGKWRPDNSGLWPDWRWQDETSKDQVLGYVFALASFWDAVAEDDSIAQQVKDDLRGDARDFGLALMEPVDLGTTQDFDLVLRDWDGCPTRYHDLNPAEIRRDNGVPLVADGTLGLPYNGFNALASLGIIRALYHVSGDEQLRAYYFDELVEARGYDDMLDDGIARLSSMYINTCILNDCFVTNFSNVNMAFVAAYLVLRHESDPALRARYTTVLQSDLWSPDKPHTGLKMQQAFFNLIWAGLKSGASDDAAAQGAVDQLKGWQAPPYFAIDRINCDAGEIANDVCTGLDGTTVLTLDDIASRGGGLAATEPVPMGIRPGSNFEWRDDPRRVNGTAGIRLNPGGDFRSAYWLGRYLDKSTDNVVNVSPIARNADGSGGPGGAAVDGGVSVDAGPTVDGGAAGDDAGASAGDAGAPDDDAGVSGLDAGGDGVVLLTDAGAGDDEVPGGCACRASAARSDLALMSTFALALLATARRTRRRTR
jgi:hypothetical protein